MSWHRGTVLAFDTETTGVDPHRDRIVTATICQISGADVYTRTWLINPGIDIPQAATDVHGITTDHAQRDGADPHTAIGDIAGVIQEAWEREYPVVAFNAAYDFTVLDSECARYGFTFDMPSVIDPFVIDKYLDRFRKGKRTLASVCEHYGVRLDAAHDATQDALAAARVAWVLAQRYPVQVQIQPVNLHGNQIQWKREQAESFGAYLAKQGKPDDVARSWPIQETPEGWSPEQLPLQAVPA